MIEIKATWNVSGKVINNNRPNIATMSEAQQLMDELMSKQECQAAQLIENGLVIRSFNRKW